MSSTTTTGLHTPPMFEEGLNVPPATPMDEATMNRLLDQDVEEVAMEEFDEAMRVAQVTATIVIPSSSEGRISPSSPSGSARTRGEPSKPAIGLPDGAGPVEARMSSHPPSLGDSEDLQNLVDQEAMEPNNFLWEDDVDDSRWVGLQIDWQMKERRYLARIRKLEDITAQVKRALDQVPPQQFSKRRHQDQDVGHDVGQDVDQNVDQDEDQDVEVVVYDVPDDDGEDGDQQGHLGQHGHHGSETQRVSRATGSSNSSRRESSHGATQHLGR